MSSSWKVIILLIGFSLSLSVQAEDPKLPDWLEGEPDVAMEPDRCGLYDWFLNEADRQTDGNASEDDLAERRVINIANKLADHHRTAQSEEYSGRVKYLVFGETGPFHFSFRVSSEQIEQALREDCRD